MELRNNVIEKNDCSKIFKLNALQNPHTFWNDVRRYTKYVTSEHSLKRWQILAEIRAKELGL